MAWTSGVRAQRWAKLKLEELEERVTPADFIVTNANDAGIGSLRQAILESNANPGPDRIAFNLATQATLPSLSQGLVAHYKFDGDLQDSSGIGNNPSATNAITFEDGQIGEGARFTTGSFIDIPHSQSLAPQQFTIAAWVRPDGPGPNNDLFGSTIIGKGFSPPTGHTTVSVAIHWRATDNRFLVSVGNVFSQLLVSTDTFAPGAFHHAAVTLNGTSIKLFVNGTLQGELGISTPITYDPTIPWTIGSTASPFRINGFPRTWNGIIDDVRIYDHPLSSDDIATLAGTADALEAGLVSHYLLDISALDKEGLNNAIATNNITFEDGQIGDGARFTPGSFIDIPHSQSLALQRFTVGAWARADSGNAGLGDFGRVIVAKNISPPEGDSSVSVYLGWRASDNRFVFGIGNLFNLLLTSQDTFAPGSFYHVAGTYDGATLRLYVDGVLQAQANLAITIPYDPTTTWNIGSTSNVYRTSPPPRLAPRTWEGVIDDVRIYDRALSASQLAALSNLGHLVDGAFVIRPKSPLPELNDPTGGTIVDGRTQTIFGGDTNPFGPEIVIDGSLVGSVNGLLILSDDNQVHGLNIRNFRRNGILISGGDNNWIAGNFIGTDHTGTTAHGNARDGVFGTAGVALADGAASNIIGTNGDGTEDQEEGNLISGNLQSGVLVVGTGTSANVVAGNLIGTSRTGLLPLGNTRDGVEIIQGASSNRIGTNGDGTADLAERNVISASGNNNIGMFNLGTDDNVIAGNQIGTDSTGTVVLGSGFAGIFLGGGVTETLIGTNGNGIADESERNIISGNPVAGIYIIDPITQQNVIAGNYIGTDVTGTQDLGNGADGVLILNGAKNNRIGTDGDGVADTSEGNLISGNGGNGIQVSGVGTDFNVLAGNTIGTEKTGTLALPNSQSGVLISAGAKSNRVGTNADGIADEAERNLVSGNGFRGIFITDPGSDHNLIAGNFVGTNRAGTATIGNANTGISVSSGMANLIGGPLPAQRNVSSGNLFGVGLGGGATGTVIQGNYIGTDLTGTIALGNTAYGVVSDSGAVATILGTDGNGMHDATEGNLISGNHLDGIFVVGPAGGFTIAGNFIGTDVSGTAKLPNRRYGIQLSNSNTNLIGSNGDGVSDATERNVISGNNSTGIVLNGGSQNTIAGNFIGTDASGTQPLGNGFRNVALFGSSSNTIGGTTPARRNVISATVNWEGIGIWNGSNNNTIQGNYIGTDVSGTLDLGNQENGIYLTNSFGNRIGGDSPGAANLISGNQYNGVILLGNSTDNDVVGNLIGTNASGTQAIPNAWWGVALANARDSEIRGNLISANGLGGVAVYNSGSRSNAVSGNSIGLTATGGPLGNQGPGVYVGNGSGFWLGSNSNATDNRIGANGDGIGDSAEGNLIAHNAGAGVVIFGATSTGNRILANSIHSNGGLGIDLGGDGVTGNDPLDADSGPNLLQNFPVILEARSNGVGGTGIRGILTGVPNTFYELDLYVSAALDPSGFGEGQRYIGTVDARTDASGHAEWSFLFGFATTPGEFITATAADPQGNTSEFSQGFAVLPPVTVRSIQINDGSAQRSMVNSITVTFTGLVELGTGAIEVRRADGTIVSIQLSVALVSNETVVTITFLGADIVAGSLADGRYQVIVRGDRIIDQFGQLTDADGDGVSGGDTTLDFFRHFGDIDGDADVDATDLLFIRSRLGRVESDPLYLWYLDVNGDGRLDGFDYAQARTRFCKII